MGSLQPNKQRVQLVIISLFALFVLPISGYPVDGGENGNFFQFPDSDAAVKLSRKDLCPPGKTSSSFRYHNATGTCYKVGQKGPCSTNMVFYSDVNSTVFGECDCDFLDAKIPLVYHPQSDRCYPVYTQAYCEPNQWLTFKNIMAMGPTPICDTDKCGDMLIFDPEDTGEGTMVEFHGKCVQLNAKNPSFCKPDEVVTFTQDHVFPVCGKIGDVNEISISNRSVYRTRSLSCKPGSKRDVHGKCRRTITIRPTAESRR